MAGGVNIGVTVSGATVANVDYLGDPEIQVNPGGDLPPHYLYQHFDAFGLQDAVAGQFIVRDANGQWVLCSIPEQRILFMGANGALNSSDQFKFDAVNNKLLVGLSKSPLVTTRSIDVDFNINMSRAGGSTLLRQVSFAGDYDNPLPTPQGEMGRFYFVGYTGDATPGVPYSGSFIPAARITVNAPEAWTNTSTPTDMFISTCAPGNLSPAIRATFKGNGNVGIGTTNPTRLLTLLQSAAGVAQPLGLHNPSNTNGAIVGIDYGLANASGVVSYGADRVTRVSVDNGAKTEHVRVGGALVEVGRWQGADRWIGLSSGGAARLHVRGATNGTAIILDTSAGSKYFEAKEVAGVKQFAWNGAQPQSRPTLTGSWLDGTAGKALAVILHNYGLITDSST